MKTYENILVEPRFHQHIALIRLNRPKVLNALSTHLMEDLVDALSVLDADPTVHVVILTGNDKAFAAGADLSQIAEDTAIDQIKSNRFPNWKRIQTFTKPLIAAVNGLALGGGCELAMACDLIIAGSTAKFGQPEIKVGITPGAGGTQRLTHAIGKSKAMLMVLTGETMGAQEAFSAGLVAKVVPAETLMQETLEIAKTIAARAPMAVRLSKESVNAAFEMDLRDGLEFERRNFYLTFASQDQKEGMKAFLEKREPKYEGK